MEIRCPNCSSANISTNYACPHCDSTNIERHALIEHITCGYIDDITEFQTDGELICPNCKSRLTGGSYRSAGSWFECPDCGRRVEVLSVIHACRDCGARFAFDRARYSRVYTYSLNKAALEEIEREILFTFRIKSFFQKLGYKVQSPGQIRGESGIQHEFDVVATHEGMRPTAVETLYGEEPIGQTRIITEYVKVFDTKADAYVIVIPSLDGAARKLAQSYGMNIIEATSPSEAMLKLMEMVGPRELEVAEMRGETEEEKEKVVSEEALTKGKEGAEERKPGLLQRMLGRIK
ncbi:MAG: hypothetical protein ACE5OO_01045 [Candidatus Bathyarchaeia archaeon]